MKLKKTHRKTKKIEIKDFDSKINDHKEFSLDFDSNSIFANIEFDQGMMFSHAIIDTGSSDLIFFYREINKMSKNLLKPFLIN